MADRWMIGYFTSYSLGTAAIRLHFLFIAWNVHVPVFCWIMYCAATQRQNNETATCRISFLHSGCLLFQTEDNGDQNSDEVRKKRSKSPASSARLQPFCSLFRPPAAKNVNYTPRVVLEERPKHQNQMGSFPFRAWLCSTNCVSLTSGRCQRNAHVVSKLERVHRLARVRELSKISGETTLSAECGNSRLTAVAAEERSGIHEYPQQMSWKSSQ